MTSPAAIAGPVHGAIRVGRTTSLRRLLSMRLPPPHLEALASNRQPSLREPTRDYGGPRNPGNLLSANPRLHERRSQHLFQVRAHGRKILLAAGPSLWRRRESHPRSTGSRRTGSRSTHGRNSQGPQGKMRRVSHPLHRKRAARTCRSRAPRQSLPTTTPIRAGSRLRTARC